MSVVVERLAGFVLDQLKVYAAGPVKAIKDHAELLKASETYIQRYQDAYGMIKPIGMSHPIPLEQIYTEVQFTTEDLRIHFGADTLEKTNLRNLRQSLDPSRIKQLPGVSAANQFPRMMVLGHPGGGKSTYLQRIGWECLRTHSILGQGHSGQIRYEYELLPVLLELKRFRSGEPASLIELIARELRDCGFPESTALVEIMLKSGKLLVLLDALDEVAEDRVAAVIDQAQALVRRAPDCRFIISCRLAFRQHFKDFQDVTLLEFSDEQIGHFIGNWFSGPEHRSESIAERFVNSLMKQEHSATLELARNPVLLGYLCVGYERTLQLSSNRAEIYRTALDIFLREWNAEKLKIEHAKQVHPSLPHETELALLAQIAFQAFSQERFFLHKDEWLKGIRDFMTELVAQPKVTATADILEKIAVSQGLVVQRTHQEWSFSHLTLQEYLAAYHVEQSGSIEQCVNEHLGDARWQEVFLILAGMKPGPLLLAMIRTARTKMQAANPTWKRWSNHLNLWEAGASFVDAQETLTAVKLAGFSIYLLIDLALAIELDPDLSLSLALALDLIPLLNSALSDRLCPDHDIDYARACDRARAPIRAFALSHALVDYIEDQELSANVLKSDLSSLMLSFQPAKIVNNRISPAPQKAVFLPSLPSPKAALNYFESLHLIFRCKRAAARVPLRQEWKQVLEQIF